MILCLIHEVALWHLVLENGYLIHVVHHALELFLLTLLIICTIDLTHFLHLLKLLKLLELLKLEVLLVLFRWHERILLRLYLRRDTLLLLIEIVQILVLNLRLLRLLLLDLGLLLQGLVCFRKGLSLTLLVLDFHHVELHFLVLLVDVFELLLRKCSEVHYCWLLRRFGRHKLVRFYLVQLLRPNKRGLHKILRLLLGLGRRFILNLRRENGLYLGRSGWPLEFLLGLVVKLLVQRGLADDALSAK